MEFVVLKKITSQFQIQGEISAISPIQSGHINTTYRVNTTKTAYILQGINHQIFTNIEQLTQNILYVTQHIQSKLATAKHSHKVLQVVLTQDEKGYHYDETTQSYWRVFLQIPDAYTYSVLEYPEQAHAMGVSFGEFHKQLSDLPAKKLHETIPDFHNTSKRFAALQRALKKDSHHRYTQAKEEIAYLLQQESIIERFQDIASQLPQRIVHQDAKLSNILFDQSHQALAVIDLDTVMPGYLCYDFGDAVREGMNTAKEDEQDLGKVSLNLPLFRSFAQGYHQATKDFITTEEVNSLILGVQLLTFEQAVRFLTDFLNGDTYYKISYPEHNLIRTKVQITLLKDILKHYDQMQDYVIELYKKRG